MICNNSHNDLYSMNLIEKNSFHGMGDTGKYKPNILKINISTNIPTKFNLKATSYKYKYLSENIILSNLNSAIDNSYVIKLTKSFLKGIYDYRSRQSNLGSSFTDKFYKSCVDNFKLQFSEKIDDNELFIIYFKQLSILFRNTEIFDRTGNSINNNCSSGTYYIELLNSFWNNTRWEELFPSMPDIAYKINNYKNKFINLLLLQENEFRLDKFCNKFLQLSNITDSSNLLLISFIDFYLFTWLNHFAIIKYFDANDREPVMIELTKHGRFILKFLSFE